MNIIQHYQKTFGNLRKKSGSSWIFIMSILNAIGISYLAAFHLSYYTWLYLGTIDRLHPLVWEFSMYLPAVYLIAIAVVSLDRITHAIISVNLVGQRIIFSAMQRFDLWYWRKYKKQGPLCQAIFRN